MKLSATSLGLACGILFGVVLFAITLLNYYVSPPGQYGHLVLLGKFFPGYFPSPARSLLGLIYGLVTGYIFGGLLAWLYNLMAGKKPSQPS